MIWSIVMLVYKVCSFDFDTIRMMPQDKAVNVAFGRCVVILR